MKQTISASLPLTVNPAGVKPLLGPSDFTLLGHFKIDGTSLGSGLNWGYGLALRYVGGQPHFLRLGYGGAPDGLNPLDEFTVPATIAGQTLGSSYLVQEWPTVFPVPPGGPGASGNEGNIWWDAAKNGLWCSQCWDYPDDAHVNDTLAIDFRTLDTAPNYSGFKGQYGFTGVGARAVFGGVVGVPAAWQSQYGFGPYFAGFGGYTSRMAQGLTPSLGLIALSCPDLTAYANNTTLPTAAFKICADHRGGTVNGKWWPGSPTAYDRSQRGITVTETYDNWAGAAPDGFYRWTWGDGYEAGVVPIEGSNKRGLVAPSSLGTGTCHYANSSLNEGGVGCCLDVYDPADLASAMNGTLRPWNVQPKSMKNITADFHAAEAASTAAQSTSTHFVDGAVFDPMTKILWLLAPVAGTYDVLMLAYSVNC